MKKIIYGILIAGCLFLVGNTATAQTFAEVEKPGDDTPWSIEMLISGNQNGIFWNLPALRARYFVNENWAARLQLGIGDGTGQAMKETSFIYENMDGTGGMGTHKVSRTGLSVQLGGEYHFLGTKKLDPYAALGVNLGVGNERNVRTDVDGFGAYAEGFSGNSKGGYMVIGGFLGLGMDFYFVENVYLGLELGLGLNSEIESVSKSETTSVAGGQSTTVSGEVPKSYSETHFGTQATFRLGWRF